MNTTQLPTCIPVRSHLLDSHGLRHVPLPLQRDEAQLRQSFLCAPQFSAIDSATICAQQRSALGVILVGDDDYYLQQAAMYLATLARKGRGQNKQKAAATEKGKAWKKLGAPIDEDEDEDASTSADISQSMVVVAPSFIDPSLTETLPGQPKGQVDLRQLSCCALYIGAPTGTVLNPYIIDQVFAHTPAKDAPARDVFFAIHPQQMDRELCQTLQLNYGFHVCQVGRPDADYLCRLFCDYAEDCFYSIGDDIDVAAIVTHTQKLRGNHFVETDLESLVLWMIQKHVETPTTEDFCFQFTQLSPQKTGLQQLDAMMELSEVKSAIHRLLAMEKLTQRRQAAHLPSLPRHRHMAFSGAPGTGKTICAQLVAQILQEEGCGSGRFVEAGREDLVGQYVGHTAPKVAALFEKARGGVLFLDEVGALVPSATADNYTDEAINALVYHMDRNPETLVIFATYPDEMTAFLASNPGLASRIAQSISFTPYDCHTLTTMFQQLAAQRGYDLALDALPQITDYFRTAMARHPHSFGNGREVRRLLNGAEEELALRMMDDEGCSLTLTADDLSQVITRLLPAAPLKRLIGFAV